MVEVPNPLYPEFVQYYTMILQRPMIIVGDAGFEPGNPQKPGALPLLVLLIRQIGMSMVPVQ